MYISVKRCELLTETGLYKCLLLLLLLLLSKGNAESTKISCQCTKPTELGYILTQKEDSQRWGSYFQCPQKPFAGKPEKRRS